MKAYSQDLWFRRSQVCYILYLIVNANAVGKVGIEVRRAYLAGLIDGDGCIMATIERHREKKFGFRVRVEVKLTLKEKGLLETFVREFNIGHVHCNRRHTALATHDWVIRDKNDTASLLRFIQPYSRLKHKQIGIALQILRCNVRVPKDLLRNARLADTLSRLNVRSKNRRKNFATMIKIPISSND